MSVWMWCIFSSAVIYTAAAIIAFTTLRRHKLGRFYSVSILAMGLVILSSDWLTQSNADLWLFVRRCLFPSVWSHPPPLPTCTSTATSAWFPSTLPCGGAARLSFTLLWASPGYWQLYRTNNLQMSTRCMVVYNVSNHCCPFNICTQHYRDHWYQRLIFNCLQIYISVLNNVRSEYSGWCGKWSCLFLWYEKIIQYILLVLHYFLLVLLVLVLVVVVAWYSTYVVEPVVQSVILVERSPVNDSPGHSVDTEINSNTVEEVRYNLLIIY